MHSKCKDVRQDVCTYATTYDFTVLQDWWSVNVMKLCSRIDAFGIVNVALHAKFFSM